MPVVVARLSVALASLALVVRICDGDERWPLPIVERFRPRCAHTMAENEKDHGVVIETAFLAKGESLSLFVVCSPVFFCDLFHSM